MDNLSNQPKPANRSERGQTTAEFVVIFPLIILFFFLIVDFGWLLKNWIVVTSSAREVARCAATQSCEDGDGINIAPEDLGCLRLQQGITGNLDNETVELEYTDESIIVRIEADNEYIGPILPLFNLVTRGALPDPMPLRAREEMRIEIPPEDDSPVNHLCPAT
jgi:hypothetical protein